MTLPTTLSRCGSLRIPLVAVLLLLTGPAARRVQTDGPMRGPGQTPDVESVQATVGHRALAALEAQPLGFERNLGQQPADFDFIATGQGYRVGLADDGATLALVDRGQTTAMLRLTLAGARPSTPQPLDGQARVSSYYQGNDESRWVTGASSHARVRYPDVYDGIDVVYYGNQRKLQYDFVVGPGADPADIALRVDGASTLTVTGEGRLRMAIGDRVVEQDRPFAYQDIDGQRTEVQSRFVVDGSTVRFALGAYDPSRPLVIDPVIAYATWYGGSGEEAIVDLDLDGAGNLYALGFTIDLEGPVRFPTTPGAHKAQRTEGASDVFVTKFTSAGAVVFSTLLGGTGNELVAAYAYDGGIAVDAAGNVHVTGSTASANFPVTPGAFDTDYNDDDPGATGSRDGFYARLSSTGALAYATYFGGRRNDEPHGIDVDAAGNVYISGSTDSDQTTGADGGFTVTAGAFDTTKASIEDIFLIRFNTGGQLTYATYLGGNSGDGSEATDVRVSRVSANVVYVVGDSRSSDFPTTPGTRIQAYNGSGDSDAVLVRLNLAQTGTAQLTYGTFLGGSGKEFFTALELDATDRVYATGVTSSTAVSFPAAPTIAGSIPPPGGWDLLVAKFNTGASGAASLVYGGRINGWYTDTGTDIAVDSLNQAWIGVASGSFGATPNPAQDFPVINSLQTQRSGNGGHGAVVQLNAAGTSILMSSLIGGNSGRIGAVMLAITAGDEVWVGGSSAGGTDRLGLVTPIQATYGGGDADATLQRIGLQADLTLTKTVDKPYPQFTVLPGDSLTYTIVVTNSTGDTSRNVVVTDTLPTQVTFVSCAATGGGVCGGTGNARTVTFPSLTSGASATITVVTTVASSVGPGTVWTNTASVGGQTPDPNTANNTGNVGNGAPTLANPSGDADGDGLTNGFEQQFGLNGLDNSPANGVGGDPDGDGKTNAQEQAEGTHPRGFVITYLAEGATGAFFDTRLALANPTGTQALVLTRFQKGDGSTIRDYRVLPPFSRATIDVESIPGLEAAEFSTLVEADVQVVADRTMSWDGSGYGSHAERGILTRTATTWYFAEGATFGPFNLFYLIQNPNEQPAQVRVRYLLGSGAPLTKMYTVAPQSRFNIWVDSEGATDPALAPLANAELSAVIESTNGVPIIAERAMYLDQPGRALGAGHESAGVTAPATQWFLAEGATGSFFDLFILIANPQSTAATVQADYLLTTGQVITRTYTVPANSRFNIWVDEEPGLADAALSTRVTSTNNVPIIVERAMWWPGPTSATWQEAHNSPGETTTGTRWAMAEGEIGGPRETDTYVLIANTSAFAGTARVTVLFEDGSSPLTRDFPLAPNSRSNVAPAADFPETAGKRFGLLIESVGTTPAQIVVERAMYSDAGGVNWAAGTNALATRLQ